MTKAEIRSLIRNILPKYDKGGIYLDRFIDATIEKVLAGMYHDVFMTAPLSLQNYTKGYGYSVPIAISTESSTGIKYCNLPESIVPLERKGSGVIRISTPAQGQFMFFPTDFREMDFMANGGYFSTVNSKVGYAVNQTRVEFYNLPASITSVRMDLLIPFSKYAETDEVKTPEITDVTGNNYQKKSETFVDRVLAILGVIQPADILDDNASRGKNDQKDN